jgi:hypothetical protein
MARNKIRQIAVDNQSSVSEPDSNRILDEGTYPAEEVDVNGNAEVHCYAMLKTKCNKSEKQCPQPVLSWLQYIEGNGGKPKRPLYSETLISKSSPETAKNKPVVRGKIGNLAKNMLIDTGSDNNVLDYKLLLELAKLDTDIKFLKNDGILKCANGTDLTIRGYTVLKINIGGTIFQTKFSVVSEIFPRIILGTRFLRSAKMKVDISNLCASFFDPSRQSEIVVPFISQSQRPGNERALVEVAGVRVQ